MLCIVEIQERMLDIFFQNKAAPSWPQNFNNGWKASYLSSHVWYYFYTHCYMYHTLYFVNSVCVIIINKYSWFLFGLPRHFHLLLCNSLVLPLFIVFCGKRKEMNSSTTLLQGWCQTQNKCGQYPKGVCFPRYVRHSFYKLHLLLTWKANVKG